MDEQRAPEESEISKEKQVSDSKKPIPNPRHKEDFTRLLSAAAKKREPKD